MADKLSDELSDEIARLIDKGSIPRHLAIIMDGNRRWAEANDLPLPRGHREGTNVTREVARICRRIDGLEYLTLYAFSTENWSRPDSEVETLFDLLDEFLQKQLSNLHEENIRLNCIGKLERFPGFLREDLKAAEDKTADNDGLTVNLALNYGGRDELLRAVKKIASKVENGELPPEQIDEDLVGNALDTAGQPDPDLLIRTSGERRLSNFLIWQVAYTELYFTEKFWPEFSENDLLDAIEDYQGRTRRFGARPGSE